MCGYSIDRVVCGDPGDAGVGREGRRSPPPAFTALDNIPPSQEAVGAGDADVVSTVRMQCRTALEAIGRRPQHGRHEDEEDLREEEDWKEVAAGGQSPAQQRHGPGRTHGSGRCVSPAERRGAGEGSYGRLTDAVCIIS